MFLRIAFLVPSAFPSAFLACRAESGSGAVSGALLSPRRCVVCGAVSWCLVWLVLSRVAARVSHVIPQSIERASAQWIWHSANRRHVTLKPCTFLRYTQPTNPKYQSHMLRLATDTTTVMSTWKTCQKNVRYGGFFRVCILELSDNMFNMFS